LLPFTEAQLEKGFIVISATHFPDAKSERAAQAYRTAMLCRDLGIPVVAVDSGSHQGILSNLELAGVIVERVGNVGGQAVQLATGMRRLRRDLAGRKGNFLVCKTELEKNIAPYFRDFLGHKNESDLVVATRSQRVRSLMPRALEIAERLGGQFLAMRLGLPADSMFGVVCYNSDHLELWEEYHQLVEQLGSEYSPLKSWLYLYLLPLMAQDRGLKVGTVEVDYLYPASIVHEEDVFQRRHYVDKRRDQLEMQLSALAVLPYTRSKMAENPAPLIKLLVSAYDDEIAAWHAQQT
jgi:hypothetical protein